MASSPGFGSACAHLFALLRLAFAPAPPLRLSLACARNSQAHSSIGTASGFDALGPLAGMRFQVLFHSPPGVLFTFPSRYWFAIGSRIVFSLAGRSPRLRTGFLVSRPTPESARPVPRLGYGALALCGAAFDPLPLPRPLPHRRPKPQIALVWAPPLSLATTHGIDLSFFSSGYFDVSVPRVASARLCVPRAVTSV